MLCRSWLPVASPILRCRSRAGIPAFSRRRDFSSSSRTSSRSTRGDGSSRSDERPQTRALAAATGGASIVGLVLPGRCTDVVRIAIVNRYPGCPAGVRTLCLSIVVLGLIDIAALAPLALASAVVPGYSSAVRTGLILLAGVGFAAAAFVAVLPRMATRGRLARSGSAAGSGRARPRCELPREHGRSSLCPGSSGRSRCCSFSERSGSASRSRSPSSTSPPARQ